MNYTVLNSTYRKQTANTLAYRWAQKYGARIVLWYVAAGFWEIRLYDDVQADGVDC